MVGPKLRMIKARIFLVLQVDAIQGNATRVAFLSTPSVIQMSFLCFNRCPDLILGVFFTYRREAEAK
jgi:hypothetical protein